MTNLEQLKIFSENLNLKIKQSGKQQKDVAADLDIPVTSLNNWCKGKSMPRWKTLQIIAEYFDSPITDFVYSAQEMNTSFFIEREMKKMDDSKLKMLLNYAKYLNEQKGE